MKIRYLIIDPKDSVAILLQDAKGGDYIELKDQTIRINQGVKAPHKIAINDLRVGDNIYKYGEIIGYATQNIGKGDHVHIHNLNSEKLML